MTLNLSATKKVAGVTGALVVLFAGAACTKQVTGTATAASHEKTSEKTSESSTKSSEETSSESESSSSSSNPAANAPDEPYTYKNGTTVTLSAAFEKNDLKILSSEVGRVIPFTIDNKSEFELDLSSTAIKADVECEGSNQYVFPSVPIVGPELLAPNQKADYQLSLGLKKVDVGKTCTITIPFDARPPGGNNVEVDIATFNMKL